MTLRLRRRALGRYRERGRRREGGGGGRREREGVEVEEEGRRWLCALGAEHKGWMDANNHRRSVAAATLLL